MRTYRRYGIQGFILSVVFFAGSFAAAQNADLQIENAYATVSYSPTTGAISIRFSEGWADAVYTVHFTDPPATARVRGTEDSAFGRGRTIEVSGQNGNIHTLTLYRGSPFVFLQTTLENAEPEQTLYKRYTPFTLTAELPFAADQLKALGTGGLSGVDKQSHSGSYAFLAIADPRTRRGVTAAWLTNERGSGVVFSDIQDNTLSLEARIDYGRLQLDAGQTEALETFIFGGFDDTRLGLEAYADAVAKRYAIALPPLPVVYCTWYHAGASNERDLITNAEFAERHLKPYGFSVVQIDDRWQDGVRSNGPQKIFERHKPDGPYPSGMKATADKIKSLGLTPGIWYMPFAGTYDDPYFADKQHLFAVKDGEPFDTRWGGTALDLTNPATQRYVYRIADRLANEWGYEYFKMDGLFTGTGTRLMYVNDRYRDDELGESTLYDPTMTHIQAYRTGLQIVRQAAGKNVYFLGCCIPQNMRSFAPAMGLVDAMRIGPDNNRNWDRMLRGPDYGSRVYFLHRRVWHNDPDPIYVRQNDVPLEQARTLCSWVTIAGQLNASSTDYTRLSEERLDILKRTMPTHTLTPRPVDLFEQKIPRIWLLSDDASGMRRDIVALYNWDDQKAATIEYPLEQIGLDSEKSYVGFDYWGNRFIKPFTGTIHAALGQAECRIISLSPVGNTPRLLSTSRHITQGIIDVKEERWDGPANTLRGISEVIGGDPYELRIVAMKDGGVWRAADTAVSEADDTAGVRIQLVDQDGPYIRVVVESKDNRQVQWTIRFN
ncbi:MAG TPA: alpha-galactosidase [Phycisphaerales bacterium]|nr:alpha-galactosidase [Phycisphaerales bacterium]